MSNYTSLRSVIQVAAMFNDHPLGYFTADDVRATAAELGVKADHDNEWGQAFRTARYQGWITCVGATEALRSGRKHGIHKVWIASPKTVALFEVFMATEGIDYL